MNWIKDIRADLHSLEYSDRKLKQFGWLMSLMLSAAAVYLWYSGAGHSIPATLLVVVAGLVTCTVWFPALLKTVYKIWMTLALALGWLVSRLILVLIFFFVLSPLALLAKVSGKNFLDLKADPAKDTYWRLKEKKLSDYKKMY